MKAKLLSGIIVATFFAAAGPSLAAVIELTPDSMMPMTYESNADQEPNVFLDAGFVTTTTGLIMYYKAEVSGGEESNTTPSLVNSYSTVFTNQPDDEDLDPENALISWEGETFDFITCPSCYLAVKDGNTDPNYYVYNLGNWDGQDSLKLTGFWPRDGGAISHVSIWGLEGGGSTGQDVPEPGPLSLLGLGLMGLWFARRKTSA